MARRRIMLVEVEPRAPQAPVFATLDPGNSDAGITFSGGNLTVTPTSDDPDSWVTAGCSIALSAGQWYWESTHTFSGGADIAAGGGLSLFLGTGIPLGSDAPVVPSSIGGPRTDGNCYAGTSAPWANAGVLTSPVVIRHWFDADALIYRTAVGSGPWLVAAPGGTNVDHATLRTPWYPAVAMFRPWGGASVSATVNFGQSPFAYEVPAGANAGVFETPEPARTTLYFSSAPFARVKGGEGLQYLARVAADVEVSRAGSCWPWGGQTESRRGSVQLINVDGALDYLAHYMWRDAPVRILRGYEGDDYGDFTLWSGCVAEDFKFLPRSPRRAELVLSDALAAADEPIQQVTYPEDHAVASEAGKPVPLVFGIPFGCTGVLQSPLTVGADAFAWQIHDGLAPTLAGLGTIYDNGIDITSRCVQWPASAPYKGFRVTGMAPVGQVTIDASGNASTTVQTIVENAWARMPADKIDPMPTIELQPGGVAGLAAWAGIYIREPRTILQVMREAMDSVCGWVCPTRDGTKLRLARVREPAGEATSLTLSRANVVGELGIELDTARYLTTRLAGRRNYTPHNHSEIAASISDPASSNYNAARVAELITDWRIIREGEPIIIPGSPLSDAYAQARNAAHRGTLLQQEIHIKAEANRVCSLWYPTRHFIRLTALLDAIDADILEPGDFVRLVWPSFGLDAGANFMVVSLRARFFSRRVDLTLWGSLPRTGP
jgi:hypothetical protein